MLPFSEPSIALPVNAFHLVPVSLSTRTVCAPKGISLYYAKGKGCSVHHSPVNQRRFGDLLEEHKNGTPSQGVVDDRAIPQYPQGVSLGAPIDLYPHHKLFTIQPRIRVRLPQHTRCAGEVIPPVAVASIAALLVKNQSVGMQATPQEPRGLGNGFEL